MTQKLEEWREIHPFRCYKNSLQNYSLSNHSVCRLTSKPKTNTKNSLVDFYMEKQLRKIRINLKLKKKKKKHKGFAGGSLVKNLPAVQEIPVQFLGQEDPLEKA